MAVEETLYTDELVQLFNENGILEDLADIKIGQAFPIVYNHEQATLTVEGVSYGTYKDLYTVSIK